MDRVARRLIIALALLLGALGGAGAATPTITAAAAAPLLRIVHASSDAPAIDAYLNGQRVATAPQFGAVTPYTTVPAGAATLQALAAGAGPGGTAFLTAAVDLREGAAYTIVAADRLAQMAPVVLDDTLGAATDGQAHVRLVHVSPDAPPVADVAVVGGPVVTRNLPFKGATGYLTVAPGTYSFEIRPAGTPQALAATPSLILEANRSYSAFVMGQLGDNTFRAVIALDNAATGGVAVVPSTGGGGTAHAAPRRAALALAIALATLATVTVGRHGTRRVAAGVVPDMYSQRTTAQAHRLGRYRVERARLGRFIHPSRSGGQRRPEAPCRRLIACSTCASTMVRSGRPSIRPQWSRAVPFPGTTNRGGGVVCAELL